MSSCCQANQVTAVLAFGDGLFFPGANFLIHWGWLTGCRVRIRRRCHAATATALMLPHVSATAMHAAMSSGIIRAILPRLAVMLHLTHTHHTAALLELRGFALHIAVHVETFRFVALEIRIDHVWHAVAVTVGEKVIEAIAVLIEEALDSLRRCSQSRILLGEYAAATHQQADN